MIQFPGVHPGQYQTFSLTSSAQTTNTFAGTRIVVVVTGTDAMLDFGDQPDVDANGGGLVSTDAPLTFYVNADTRVSFKSVSGTGTITFWNAA